MRITLKSTLLISLLLANVGWGFAHALYIDTVTEGKAGKSQEVRVYYSEFADGTAEKVADWYSDVRDFELWLVHPDGNRTQLKTTAKDDHFLASFVPETNGAYRLEISHTAEDPGEGTAYQFNTFAQVYVGKAVSNLPLTANGPELYLVENSQHSKNAREKTFVTYFKGEPQGGIAATVFLPSGETKEIKSNSEGILMVDFGEKGTHFIEATTFHEKEKGSTKKSPYHSVWRCATQKIEIE